MSAILLNDAPTIEDIKGGHRKRLKDKLVRSNLGNLHDCEILELILFNSIPRKDVKPLAKLLLKKFGNLGKVINASPVSLMQINGIGESTIVLFKIFQESIYRITKEQILKKPIINSWEKLLEYLRSSIGYSGTENLYTLYLNNKNILITDEIHCHGTVSSISIYPREIVKAALYYDASSVILVHNHPSGVTTPSQLDKELTRSTQEALKTINVKLLDHVIISSSSYFSFKTHNLLI